MNTLQLEKPVDQFEKAVITLMENVGLFEEGPPRPPWHDKRGKARDKAVRDAICSGKDALPLHYQERYVEPLLQNLPSIMARADRNDNELVALVSSVYGHGDLKHKDDKKIQEEFHDSLKCLLAVISNTYRSFLGDSRLSKAGIPVPEDNLPPLAAFFSPTINERKVAPFMLTKCHVKKMMGSPVGVVSIPSAYRDHPLLWAAVAHEIGGHEFLNLHPTLLGELQEGVRSLFFTGPMPEVESTRVPIDQVIGLIWQYWTEEAASDVCGVLNIGPSYGKTLAVYQATLNAFVQLAIQKVGGDITKIDGHTIKAFFQEKRKVINQDDPNRPFIRHWSTLHPRLIPFLTESDTLPDLDPHPIDILKLHVMIGAINSLTHLNKETREKYTKELETIADICSAGHSWVSIYGNIQTGNDKWRRITTRFELKEMQKTAEKVGGYIASTRLQSLDGNNLQSIETWDDYHESNVQKVKKTLIEAGYSDDENERTPVNIENMGDDAQLIAGVSLAFYEQPFKYEFFNDSLIVALLTSYSRDPFWGDTLLRSTYDWTRDEELEKKLKERENTVSANKKKIKPALNLKIKIGEDKMKKHPRSKLKL